jgi:hypothetical protein
MGINRWEEQQERADKTGRDPDRLPADREKGDESSRLQSSEEPAENREKQEVAKKLREREDNRE